MGGHPAVLVFLRDALIYFIDLFAKSFSSTYALLEGRYSVFVYVPTMIIFRVLNDSDK